MGLVEPSGIERWRDTTGRVLEYFEAIKSRLLAAPAPARQDEGDAWREQGLSIVDGYIETLAKLGGRTGILVAKQTGPGPR